MSDDELSVLRDALSTHRSMLMGALHRNADLDIDRAFQVHSGLSRILARWDEYTANEQRQIVRTIEYLVNADDDVPDLTTPNGFTDDLAELRKLEASSGLRLVLQGTPSIPRAPGEAMPTPRAKMLIGALPAWWR